MPLPPWYPTLMAPDDLAAARADVIERAITIEGLLDAIISQQYLGRVTKRFLFEVLYDEYFNFGLKARIYSKITPEESSYRKLQRLSSIRNYFAHRGRLALDFGRDGGPFVPDPKDTAKAIDFGALYAEFIKLADTLVPELVEQYRRLGGKLMDDSGLARMVIHAEDE